MNRTRIAFIQKDWEDNLGVLWISAVLKEHGFATRVWVESRDTYAQVREFQPALVGYSCITGAQTWVRASVERLRAAGVKALVVVGGPHPTFFPEMIEDLPVEVICRGEGEYPFLELAQALEENREPYQIKNLYFKIGREVIKNDLRPLVADLDSLPFPDRSYYDRYPFLAQNPYKILITSRGCPYRCTFCFNHVLMQLYGRPASYVRRRSVAAVMEEIGQIRAAWGLEQIRFSDDHFALNKKWLKEFCHSYRREIGLPYTINARADVLDEERVSLLAESGCRLVCFGIESGREELRNKILKKGISDKEIFQAAQLLKRYGLKFLTSNIIGLPGESSADAWETIALNQRLGTNLPWFSMMQYYPGTEIYEQAREAGLLSEDQGVEEITSYFDNSYLKQENLPELQNIHSFAILVSRFKFLEPLARYLTKRFPPNPLFKMIFKLSYGVLTVRRANLRPQRLLRGLRYYLAGC